MSDFFQKDFLSCSSQESGKLWRYCSCDKFTSPAMILWMIFGGSKVWRIVRATAPESIPSTLASSAMFLNLPFSLSESQFQKYWLSRVNHLFFRASKPFRRTNPDFFTKNGKKSNFGPFSSSPVNAGCSRYPFVYVSLISSIQAC